MFRRASMFKYLRYCATGCLLANARYSHCAAIKSTPLVHHSKHGTIIATSKISTPEIEAIRRSAYLTVREAIDTVESANEGVPRGLHRFGTTWRNYTSDHGNAVDEQLANVRQQLAAQLVIMRKITEQDKLGLATEEDYASLVQCTKFLHILLQQMFKVVQETRTEAVAKVNKIGWDELLQRAQFSKLNGGSLLSDNPKRSLDSIVQGGAQEGESLLCVYFSAGWCGPCRRFTPALVDAYMKIKKKHSNFEVVFVSWDQTSQGCEQYARDLSMPWASLDYDQRELAQLLAMKADVETIPRLLVLKLQHDRTGIITNATVAAHSGNNDIVELGDGAFEKWLS